MKTVMMIVITVLAFAGFHAISNAARDTINEYNKMVEQDKEKENKKEDKKEEKKETDVAGDDSGDSGD